MAKGKTKQDAKAIAKDVVKVLKELDRKGELARAGKKVAKAINNLRKERRLTWEQLH
ncbi:hypothetical protein LCGC14_2482510, partial [marine sediment metagenome]